MKNILILLLALLASSAKAVDLYPSVSGTSISPSTVSASYCIRTSTSGDVLAANCDSTRRVIMTGSNGVAISTLTVTSMSVTGNKFSVGGSTLIVDNGMVGINKYPTTMLDILDGPTKSGINVAAGGVNGTYYPLAAKNYGGTKGIWLRDNGHLGINDSTADAELDILSDKAGDGFILSISSQNDVAGNIMGITGDGNIYFWKNSVYTSTFDAVSGSFSIPGAIISTNIYGSNFYGVMGATEIVNASMLGNGSVGNALGVDPTSGTLRGNVFNNANQLVLLDSAGKLPAIDGSQLTGIVAGAGLASTQVWSGGNTLYGNTTFYGGVNVATMCFGAWGCINGSSETIPIYGIHHSTPTLRIDGPTSYNPITYAKNITDFIVQGFGTDSSTIAVYSITGSTLSLVYTTQAAAGYINRIAAKDNMIYVGGGLSAGTTQFLETFNISPGGSLTPMGYITYPEIRPSTNAIAISTSGNFVYLGGTRLTSINVSNPSSPAISLSSPAYSTFMCTAGDENATTYIYDLAVRRNGNLVLACGGTFKSREFKLTSEEYPIVDVATGAFTGADGQFDYDPVRDVLFYGSVGQSQSKYAIVGASLTTILDGYSYLTGMIPTNSCGIIVSTNNSIACIGTQYTTSKSQLKIGYTNSPYSWHIVTDILGTTHTVRASLIKFGAGNFAYTNATDNTLNLVITTTSFTNNNVVVKSSFVVNGGISSDMGLMKSDGNGGLFSVRMYTFSDENIKENILPLAATSSSFLSISPVSYTDRLTKNRRLGFTTQDIEKYYPELVKKNAANGVDALDYTGLIAPMVKTIQELEKRIKILEGK